MRHPARSDASLGLDRVNEDRKFDYGIKLRNLRTVASVVRLSAGEAEGAVGGLILAQLPAFFEILFDVHSLSLGDHSKHTIPPDDSLDAFF